MTHNTDDIMNLLRGTAAVYSEKELATKLTTAQKEGRPLRVKLGLDPSSPDIHIGHAVVLGLMRRFQDLGHKAVLIVGDYTARIGDPSGKSKTRPMLTPDEIEANAQTYLTQATKILDDDPDKLELRRNGEWLSKMSFADVIKLSSQMTVAQMLERDTFATRYKAGQPISVHEFLYPLMQGWDSVCINADVELGGTDQTFNNLVGRELQTGANQVPQVVIVCPILRGLDGTDKMSKSLGNYIGVTDTPNDMFGKTMSIPDALMHEWFTLCTNLSSEQIDMLCDQNKTHPRDAKEQLGRYIVKQYHTSDAAEAAANEFRSRFSQGNLPEDIKTVPFADTNPGILTMICDVGFASSNSDARRLVKQGAVSINNEKVADPTITVDLAASKDGVLLKVGKRRICKVIAVE